MARTPAIGKQDFGEVIEKNCFYVDKTYFIKEWWENADDVTLITRPKRFGKTLTLSMLQQFFSVGHAGRGSLFEGLSIWKDEKYRKLQGTYPVISLSFLNVGAASYEGVYADVCNLFARLYRKYAALLDDKCFIQSDRDQFFSILNKKATYSDMKQALSFLSELLYRYYGKKVIILIDEYDTPINQAYVHGYWDDLVTLFRDLLTDALKGNQYLERALLTGITRVSKESFFSKLNNPEVVSVTSNKYETAFGFTEHEVLSALSEFGLADTMDEVRYWYDGFRFGNCSSIYNPWSIMHYLGKRTFAPYWVNTSSNELVSILVRRGSQSVKEVLADLLIGKSFKAKIDEQLVFQQLKSRESAIWSLLLASGYLKALSVDGETYELTLTNHEVKLTFRDMIRDWFSQSDDYNDFIKALLKDNLDAMNQYLNTVVAGAISSFDSGTKPSETPPERFYHGLMLGLLVELDGRYVVTSNRESGFGRYDVMLDPLQDGDDGIILEFKVQNPEKERCLQDTAKAALKQIVEKNYTAELAKKVPGNRIRIYGFAFAGKNVLIDGGYADATTGYTD